jgi:thiamine biosynthesis lipoprotein
MENKVGYGDPFIFRFNAIGTQWEIETMRSLPLSLGRQILERVELFDNTYSRFRTDSLVFKIANAPYGGSFQFPDDAVQIFDLYDQLYRVTDGAVDPLVGRRLELLGYDANYSLIPSTDALLSNLDQRMCWETDIVRDEKTLVTNRPLVIDIGAAGKGYLVDIVCEMLLNEGVDEFIVDASGDIRQSGKWDLPIGLEHPHKPEHVIGVVDLQDSALCASASNRRNWGDGLHHILDARLGLPVRDVIATWVVADNAMTADGLATALFFKEASEFKKDFQFSSVRMLSNGTIEKSENFEGELYFL